MNENVEKRAATNAEAVLAICARPGRVLVLTQDNPDPDALGSAAALRDLVYARLDKRVVIGYGGFCGRAENVIMLKSLHIDAKRLKPGQLERFKTICLVDTQPRFGNNLLVPSRPPEVVIDHHLPTRSRPWLAEFVDVRTDYGATATILHEYLVASSVKPSADLATAMFYGIQSDTQDLGREAGPADVNAYRDLFLLADKKKLGRIHHAPVPEEYLTMLRDSLGTCVIAGATIMSYIPSCHNPDMIAEVADLLIRVYGMRYAVCYGICGDTIRVSARALDARGNAATRMKHVVARLGKGGGHRTMSGGQIPLDGDAAKRVALVHERILGAFAPNHEAVPLRPPAATGPSHRARIVPPV